jgi:hypothetical protein
MRADKRTNVKAVKVGAVLGIVLGIVCPMIPQHVGACAALGQVLTITCVRS